jgi:formimidoylglutamate deiminase
LLKHGFTAVGEFHYLHNDADGCPYTSPTELSDRVIAAALDAGIHITHLPVFYETGNFGGVPTGNGQKRFTHTLERYLTLLTALRKRYGDRPEIVIGVAPHSLRAITPKSLTLLMEALEDVGLARCPIHIHIAEQEKEVADCITWSGQRPVEWLMAHERADARWCLIHATHMVPAEIQLLAASGAVAGLCPTTEANLGDGLFPAESYLRDHGKFGIGTDSHVCVSPWEELRQLEYGQRLATRRRAILCDETIRSVGRTLFTRTAADGSQALGINGGHIACGYRADLVAISGEGSALESRKGDCVLDTLMFGGIQPEITDVLVAGRRVIANGHHALEEESTQAMTKVMKELLG